MDQGNTNFKGVVEYDGENQGTWTPSVGNLTVVGSFSSTGKWEKIGNVVFVSGTLSGTTSVAINANQIMCANLPFTVLGAATGTALNVSSNTGIVINPSGTSIYSASALAATAMITFSAYYFTSV